MTTDDGEDLLFWARLSTMLENAVAALSEDDRAARVEWCQRTGRHGVTAYEAPDNHVMLFWGGHPLLSFPRDIFAEEAYFEDLVMTRVSLSTPDGG